MGASVSLVQSKSTGTANQHGSEDCPAYPPRVVGSRVIASNPGSDPINHTRQHAKRRRVSVTRPFPLLPASLLHPSLQNTHTRAAFVTHESILRKEPPTTPPTLLLISFPKHYPTQPSARRPRMILYPRIGEIQHGTRKCTLEPKIQRCFTHETRQSPPPTHPPTLLQNHSFPPAPLKAGGGGRGATHDQHASTQEKTSNKRQRGGNPTRTKACRGGENPTTASHANATAAAMEL